MAKKTLFSEQLISAIVHTVDRLTELFIRVNATRLVWPREFDDLYRLGCDISSFWMERRFSYDDMDNQCIMSRSWDLLQCDFLFDQPTSVPSDDPIRDYLKDCHHQFSERFNQINLPVLDRLRAADLTRPFEFDVAIQAACRAFCGELRALDEPSDGTPRTVPENIAQILWGLLRRYPFFLYPTVRFLYIPPTNVGLRSFGLLPGFSASPETSTKDLLAAIEDYKYLFLITRGECRPTDPNDDMQLYDHLAAEFFGKKNRDNVYVSQQNSICNTLCAMHAWELVRLKNRERNDAIVVVAKEIHYKGVAARVKSVRERYGEIEKFLQETVTEYKTLMAGA